MLLLNGQEVEDPIESMRFILRKYTNVVALRSWFAQEDVYFPTDHGIYTFNGTQEELNSLIDDAGETDAQNNEV